MWLKKGQSGTLSLFPGIRCAGFDCKSKRDDKAENLCETNACQMKWVSFCPSCTNRTCIEKGSSILLT